MKLTHKNYKRIKSLILVEVFSFNQKCIHACGIKPCEHFVFMTDKHQDQIESIKAYERATKVLREKRTKAFSNIIKGFCRIQLSICLNFLLKK